MKFPVAFFSFNRPEHSDKALDALSKCIDIDLCDFYFFSDGPRNNSDESLIFSTRAVLNKWATFFSAQIIESQFNQGLAKSIVSGVSELCDRYGCVVVIEDDLIVNPNFLRFMITSLSYYQDEPRVMQICGLPLRPPDTLSADAFFLPVTSSWGWATWGRAWKNFSWTPADFEVAKNDHYWCKLFNLNGAGSFFSMLEDRMAGRNDSWAILWWYAVSRKNGLVLYPSHSLVWNSGFDGSGTHCGDENIFQDIHLQDFNFNTFTNSLAFPKDVDYLPVHLNMFEEFLRERHFKKSTINFVEDSILYRLMLSLIKFIRKTFKYVIN